MTQDQQPPTSSTAPVSKLSSLAVLAIIAACIPCPPVSLVGCVLGLMALSRIRNSGGLLRGRKLARIAVVAGLLVSLGGMILMERLADELDVWRKQAITESLHGFLVEAGQGNDAEALAHWDLAGTPISVSEVQAFGTELTQRLGQLKSLQVGKISPAAGGSLMQPPMQVWLLLEFDGGSRNGSSRLIIETSGDFNLRARIQNLKIEDVDLDITIPASSPASQADDAGEAESSES
ncbi:MAG: DUF4190 domain-containing protein [Phycisphaerales bacterium]|nr:DUF4190 domain-containing protein [Phycisphaerales bacterium]